MYLFRYLIPYFLIYAIAYSSCYTSSTSDIATRDKPVTDSHSNDDHSDDEDGMRKVSSKDDKDFDVVNNITYNTNYAKTARIKHKEC